MAITQLWTELYRPKIIDDYVFRDEAQRRQVTTWVKEKTIPHLLFSGAAGTGKCLIGSELIDVQIDTKTLSTKQLIKLANSNNSTPGVGSFVYFQLPIKSLFEILNIDTVEYDTAISTIHTVLINSVTAFVHVNQFVKKQHECACYSLENGESISCSVDHLVFDQGVARKIKECHAIDTINGSVQIVNEYPLGIQDVYDVALNYPHQYVTPNGVIHHNTTLAKVLINEIGIEDYDVLEINASRDNNVDTVRDKIINFVQMIPFGPFKVVLLDECDAMSISAQSILRGVMETYASSSRFILTCNYPNKVIPALHSRCQGFHVEKTDQVEFTARVATILITENVEFDLDTLDTYVKLTYPDLRKCINTVQQNVSDLKLMSPTAGVASTSDYKVSMVSLFKAGKIQEARKLLCSQARPEEIEEIFTWMYQNLDLFGKDEEQKDSAVLIIKQGLCDHTICADAEINLAATLIKLARNMRES